MGASLALTMVVNIIVPHVSVFSKGFFARPLKLRLLSKRAVTKVEMDEVSDSK